MIFCTNPSLGNFDYSEKVFRFIKDPCLFVYDVMIKAFAKRSSFRSAVELFRRLREEGLCPYNFTYPFVFDEIPERNRLCWNLNVTISRYVRCRRFEEALDMFRRMSCESNEKPDEATVLGKEIHEYVRSELGFVGEQFRNKQKIT
ncbi:pentatricopeptide repeat-containing protein [Pyrus ussuriensis x Pyrus communis]|uniref:Pentatricopeptide repeat-containing protein n=1 Tax=Pyrus ussuriensis x Pyrus communis TaxID=2448454 RepID=A0A5N5HAD5_9ROSA|nr:pentatricopeptide repeat-containing protein [Pyrus ussuriensis x Pyrus communis]